MLLTIMLALSVAPTWNIPATQVRNEAEVAMVDGLNTQRRSAGLSLFEVDGRLTEIARLHADDMLRQHYFSHTSPDGRSPFDRMHAAHYDFSYAAENIALAQEEGAAEHALWNSEPHRKNILGEHYRRIGVGVVSEPDGRMAFVEDFSN
ncbi:MAG: CAP domain-containing protein [Candidatus Eremiobacteraeota bacterium]|nr:CAP domain-containing protein [Candidatus Eremiobacteraeota bacterium]